MKTPAKSISFAGLALAFVLSACAATRNGTVQSGPIKSGPNRYPVRIVGVDGKLFFPSNSAPDPASFDKYGPRRNDSARVMQPELGSIELKPGTHDLLIEAGPFGTTTAQQVSIAFKVEACTQYFLIADTNGLVAPAWKLVVEHEEPISDCAARVSSQ